MEDIYRETVTAIENGANFRIDFQSRSLKVNGRHMIRNGRYDGAPWLPEYGCGDFSRMWRSCTAAINIRYHRSAARASPAGISWHCPKVTSRTGTCCTGNTGYRAIRAGILYPLPDYRRVHMESRNDGQMVLAKRKRQGPGDTQKMGGTRK